MSARNSHAASLAGSFKKFSMLAVAVTVLAFTSSCNKKDVKPDDSNAAAMGKAGENGGVTDKPINFDPQGSDSGKIDGLHTIYFDYDKAGLTSEAKKLMVDNIDWMKKNGKSTIQVEGHTDERGSVEYNLALGDRRAKAVRKYLVDSGIDGKRLKVISYGKEKPMVTGDSEAAYSKNRRANFVPLSE